MGIILALAPTLYAVDAAFRVDADFVYARGSAELKRVTHLATKNAQAVAEAKAHALLSKRLFMPNLSVRLDGDALDNLREVLYTHSYDSSTLAGVDFFEHQVRDGVAFVTVRFPRSDYDRIRAEVGEVSREELSNILLKVSKPIAPLLLHELSIGNLKHSYSTHLPNYSYCRDFKPFRQSSDLLLGDYLSVDEFKQALDLLSFNEALIIGENFSFIDEYRSIYAAFLNKSSFKKTAKLYGSKKSNRLGFFEQYDEIKAVALSELESLGGERCHLLESLLRTKYSLAIPTELMPKEVFSSVRRALGSNGADFLSPFQSAIEQHGLSPDMVNLMARALEQQAGNMSVVLYFLASETDPEHPYAGANLAIALKRVGYPKLASKFAAIAIQSDSIAEWSVDALQEEDLP